MNRGYFLLYPLAGREDACIFTYTRYLELFGNTQAWNPQAILIYPLGYVRAIQQMASRLLDKFQVCRPNGMSSKWYVVQMVFHGLS